MHRFVLQIFKPTRTHHFHRIQFFYKKSFSTQTIEEMSKKEVKQPPWQTPKGEKTGIFVFNSLTLNKVRN
jgi:hypothetical protein